MKNSSIQEQIIVELTQLLDKTCFSSIGQVQVPADFNDESLEMLLVNIKAINARYEKADALTHVHNLMEEYNIQIDELIEQISR